MVAPQPPKGGVPPELSGQNVINLHNLSPQELHQLRQQVEEGVDYFQNAIISLKDVQLKMQESGNCVKSLSPDKKELLVPLTSSMFVRGEVEDPNHVLIDIGTGYFVEKDLEQAKDYFKRKVEFLTAQIEKVQQILREKTTIRAAVVDILEGKLQAQAAAASSQKKPISS